MSWEGARALLSGINSGMLIVYPSYIISCMVKKKKFFSIKLWINLMAALGFAWVTAASDYLYFNTWWVLVVMHMLSFVVLWLCNDYPLKTIIYLKIWSTVFYHLMLQIPGAISTAIDAEYFQEYSDLVWMFSPIFTLILVVIFTLGIRKRQLENLSLNEIFSAIAIVCLSIVLNRVVFNFYRNKEQISNIVFLFQVALMFCTILILYMQLEIHYRQSLKRESVVKESIWEMEKRNFEQKKEQIDLINRKCHDLKHQIAALQYISDRNIFDKNIQDLKAAVNVYDETNHIKNRVIGTVLADKKMYFAQYGVELNYVVDGYALEFMDRVDLYILLGNALDNAFECLCKLENEADKKIWVQIYKQKNFIRMIMRNKYNGEISMKNGLPISTKAEKESHGIGMKSMQDLVRKYNGDLVVELDKSQFILKVMIPLG